MAGKRRSKVRRTGSLWTVKSMESKAQLREAVKHAKKLLVLHAMRMDAPLDGLGVGSPIKLAITLDRLGELTGIRRKNDLIAALDWLEEHKGLKSERVTDSDGWVVRRSGVYVLGKVVPGIVPVRGDRGEKRLMSGRSKTQWLDLKLSKNGSIKNDTTTQY